MPKYEIEYLQHIIARSLLDEPSRLCQRDAGHDILVNLPFNGFGEREGLPADTTVGDAFDGYSFLAQRPTVFLIDQALVHTKYGLITVDDFGVRDSTVHFPWFRFPDFTISGPLHRETSFEVPRREPSVEISAAYSVHAGIHDNYYHWTILTLGKISRELLSCMSDRLRAKPVVLIPEFCNAVQRDGASTLSNYFGFPIVWTREQETIGIQQLVYPVAMRSGLRPHPVIREPMEILKQHFYDSSTDYPEKVYISRRDSGKRMLVNEAEIEDFLGDRGFEIVSLSGKSLCEQINIFAHARKIISPHGAALTNIVFCEPGTSILEFHMPSYLNWCYRRLAGVFGLRYGYLPGNLETDTDLPLDRRSYSLSLYKLRDAVDGGWF